MGLPADSDDVILDELVALAKRRPDRLQQFVNLTAARQYRPLYRLFRRYVPAGAEVLDWGAGNGHFSYFLSRAGYHVTGFSFEGFDFQDWLRDPGYRFIAGDPSEPTTLPFATASFEAIASVGVLEHVREMGGDEGASLREIGRCLRPGGVFICYHLPNRASLIDAVARRILGKPHHAYRYIRADIEILARGAFLDILEVHRYGILPRNSCRRMPRPLREARIMANAWDALDEGLRPLLSPFCQNYLFIARKRRGPGPSGLRMHCASVTTSASHPHLSKATLSRFLPHLRRFAGGGRRSESTLC